MKIIVLLFASFFSIGFAYTEVVKEDTTPLPTHTKNEQPVMHIMLDTIEIIAVDAAIVASIK
jgi:hypothetical protein